MADANGMTGLECSASGVAVSSTGEALLLHTNHPLESADLDQRALSLLTDRGRIANSERRLSFLRNNVKPGPDAIQALLSDPATPLCMVADRNSRSQTFGSVLFRLGAEPQARFRLGLPGRAEWHSAGFSS